MWLLLLKYTDTVDSVSICLEKGESVSDPRLSVIREEQQWWVVGQLWPQVIRKFSRSGRQSACVHVCVTIRQEYNIWNQWVVLLQESPQWGVNSPHGLSTAPAQLSPVHAPAPTEFNALFLLVSQGRGFRAKVTDNLKWPHYVNVIICNLLLHYSQWSWQTRWVVT